MPVDDQRLKTLCDHYTYIETIQHYSWPGTIIAFRIGSDYF